MTHVLVHVLEFDDGDVLTSKWCEGTRAECQRARELLATVAYSGPRKLTAEWTAIVTAAERQTALDEESAMEARP